MKKVPILIVAYNRPETLGRLLIKIESLESRQVIISIDGPTTQSRTSNRLVLESAVIWKESSKHNVEILYRDKNFGIYDHLPIALGYLFSSNTYGIILEDDIDFVPTFIDFIDKNTHLLEKGNLWSICGHNPVGLSQSFRDKKCKLTFEHSYFHSIWGWATSKENALKFLEGYASRIELEEALDILKFTSKQISRDPLLRRAFVLTWMRKLSGWNIRRERSGWDTRWAYEGWKAGKVSILPSISLSQESRDQSEGQTHKHEISHSGDLYRNENNAIYYATGIKRREEIKRIRTWGVSRLYSWFYAIRVMRQLKELSQ